MSEKQANLFGSPTDTREHPDDSVVCVCGCPCLRRMEAYRDCEGQYHACECDRNDRDVELVEDFLNAKFEKVDDYTTGHSEDSENYTDEYSECVCEAANGQEFFDRLLGWVTEEWGDCYIDHKAVTARVIESIDVSWKSEAVYNYSDSLSYPGDKLLVWEFKIGEVENQIEINSEPKLLSLHKARRLNDVLDRVNSEAIIHRSRRREINQATGECMFVGRETYMPVRDWYNHPDIQVTFNICGGWAFVLDDETLQDATNEAILAIYRGDK